MIQLWSKLIEQLNTSVVFLLLVTSVLFWVVYNIGKWKERFFAHDSRLDKVEGLSDKVVKIETTVNLIYQNTNPRPYVQSHSPISLTEIGKQTADKIRANEIFKRIGATLEEKVNNAAPKNAYDIQTKSFEVATKELFSLLNEDEFTRLKDEAYLQGARLEDFGVIFGVILRNHILEKRQIPISEVDKCDPHKSNIQ